MFTMCTIVKIPLLPMPTGKKFPCKLKRRRLKNRAPESVRAECGVSFYLKIQKEPHFINSCIPFTYPPGRHIISVQINHFYAEMRSKISLSFYQIIFKIAVLPSSQFSFWGQNFCVSRLENLGKSWQQWRMVVQGCRYTCGARVHVYLGCEGHVDHVSVHVGVPQERIRAEIVRLIILELNLK